jgi:phenylacetate-CoA ligase
MGSGSVFRNVVYPLYHCLKRDGVNDGIESLGRTQWLAAADLRELQQEKLTELIAHCSKYVPHYRGVFKTIGLRPATLAEPDNFGRIPILTKGTIRSVGLSLVSENLEKNGITANSTSGSSGEALKFYTDYRSESMRKAAELRGKQWAGWRLGDRSISLWGAPIDEAKRRTVRAAIHGWITRSKMLSSYDLSEASLEKYCRIIEKFGPSLLVSYPGPLEQLANYCVERKITFPTLKGVITSAERLWPHQRSTIETAMGLQVSNRYGSREFGLIAQECEAHTGLHVSAERVFMEIVNDDGSPCASGETGRILLTDVDNYGAPMIRYDIGDRGTWAPVFECTCGRSLPLLEQVSGTFWTLLLRSKPGIKQFQVVQETIEGIVVRYVPDSESGPPPLDYFRQKIIEKCGENFNIEFLQEHQIELTESGKNRLIVSRCGSDSS